MKAKLTYDLNDPHDTKAHLCAINSEKMAMAIWELQNNCRKTIEWEIDSEDVDKYGALEICWKHVHEIFEDINSSELVI